DPEVLKEIRVYEAVEDYTNERYLKLIHDNYYPKHVLRIPAEDWPEDVSNAFAEINFPIYLKMQGPSEFGIVGEASLKNWDVTSDLNKIEIPFLSIGAEHDTMDPKQMEWMADQVQNGSYLHCPNGSHMAMWDDTENYFRGLINFINEL
ncbi:MAG: proline iminopeptidase, partial [Flavobacteriaceae bacterium]|nr:proline iminopeptidase [Flavobacteriaceae bacterium]